MAVAKQQPSYQCDQCGSPNIVALSVLYEQGTRTYSSPAYWGKSQTYSAQGAAPPRRKGYGVPFLIWGFLLYFVLFWSWAFYGGLTKYPDTTQYALGILGTHWPRLCRRASSYLSQSCPLQSRSFSHALPELGPHIYVSPLRKAASYSFMNSHFHCPRACQSLPSSNGKRAHSAVTASRLPISVTPGMTIEVYCWWQRYRSCNVALGSGVAQQPGAVADENNAN